MLQLEVRIRHQSSYLRLNTFLIPLFKNLNFQVLTVEVNGII